MNGFTPDAHGRGPAWLRLAALVVVALGCVALAWLIVSLAAAAFGSASI